MNLDILGPTVFRPIHLIAGIGCWDMQESSSNCQHLAASQFLTERTLTSSKELFVTVALAAPSAL